MIVRKPEALVPSAQFEQNIIRKLERYARVCYKSEDKMETSDPEAFLMSKVKMGHESIIEHEKITVMLIIDRGISHEAVRHRAGASYSQESTRYCRYDQDKFGNEITVIEPYFFLNDQASYDDWYASCKEAEDRYMKMIGRGRSAQEARSVLPNSLKTEIVITYNLREWRHFFRLRCDLAAHPQMRQVAIPLLHKFRELLPALFSDIRYDEKFPVEHYAPITMTDDFFNIGF